MAPDEGWRPLRPPEPAPGPTGTLEASPFSRLAVTHAFAVSGDTLLTMALAGSLFFSIPPTEAKGKVALYLALTMAPFAVVAPLLGRALDRSPGGRRLVVLATAAGRCVVCLLMAGDIKRLLLFPEAFAFLVLSKAYAITKSSLVPAAVVDDTELVEANSKLQLIAVVVGFVAAAPGVVVLKTAGAPWVLRLAAVVFACATVASLRIRPSVEAPDEHESQARAELRRVGIVLAASAMGLLRSAVGFLTFLVAFGFRRDHAPSWWFGVVLAASMAGSLAGAWLAPILRRSVREEHMLAGALGGVAVVALIAARGGNPRPWAAVVAAALGIGASAGKLAFDSIVQRDAHDAVRGRWFARFETRFQLSWVIGSFVPVVIPIPLSAGFVVIAAVGGFAAVSYLGGLRAGHAREVAA